MLKKCVKILVGHRAKWGVSGSLYPKSALRGADGYPRSVTARKRALSGVLKARSHAAENHESGQVRKEAAISGHFWVTWGSLAGAFKRGTALW